MPNDRDKAKSAPYDYKRAWNYSLWLLGRKAYTRSELRRKLARKEVSETDIARILEQLEGYAFVDDAAYARGYVRDRRRRKGTLALRQELRRKGVPEEDIASALDGLDDTSQLEAAAALLAKHAWRFSRGDSRRDRARAFAFLARRGFPAGVAREALDGSEVGRYEDEA